MIFFDKIKRVIERPERLLIGIDFPKTFTEKLQWLKFYDHNPIYHQMVDKYEVKKFVADIIGEKYIIPTLGVWDSFEAVSYTHLTLPTNREV